MLTDLFKIFFLCGVIVFSSLISFQGDAVAVEKQTVSAFLRVKDEIKTIEACLNSIDGVFDKIVIIHSNEKDDGSVAVMNKWCSARSSCEIHEYPHRVIPSHHSEYRTTKVDYKNTLAAYYNFGLMFFEPEEWVVKIDGDQVYIKDRLEKVVSFIKTKANPEKGYGLCGYNTFNWKGYFVKFKNAPINGKGGDSFIVKRKYISDFYQMRNFEAISLKTNERTHVLKEPVWFHFMKSLKSKGVIRKTDDAPVDEVAFLDEEEKRLFKENILPYLENSPYRDLKLEND